MTADIVPPLPSDLWLHFIKGKILELQYERKRLIFILHWTLPAL